MANSKKLLGSISLITISYLMSRVLGFFREVLLAKWTGITSASDTLDLAFIIPDFLFYLSAGGYLAITLIPILSDISKNRETELNDYFVSLLYGLSIVFFTISFLSFLFRYQIVNLLDVENPDLFIKLFTPIIFSQTFFFIGAILMSFQYFKNDFKYAALAPVIYNSSIILFGWFYSTSPESTVYGFAIGGLVGSILGHLLLQLLGAKNNGLIFKALKPKLEHISQYIKISFPLIIGQSIAVIDEQLFRYFGSLLSTGSIASFRYARRVALIPVGVIAQAVGVASYPTLSKLFVENKFGDFKLLIKKQLSALAVINTGVLIIFLKNSENIIEIVYQRGLFSSEDTSRVSSIFMVVAFGLIPWSLNQIITRSYYVQKNYWFPVWVGTFITFVTIFTLKILSNPSGESYAVVIISSLWVNTLILSFFLKIKNERLIDKSLLLDLLKILVVGFIAYFLSINFEFYSGSPILELIFDTLFIFIVILMSLFVVKMNYINLKRNR
ncbi:MAG: murein biosynthesis integral membrane protein MurJ [Candidatus Actinomarina sp.]